MDYQSIKSFDGKRVKLTLANNFWYRAKILSVSKEAVRFVEEKGSQISVAPSFIVFMEELQ